MIRQLISVLGNRIKDLYVALKLYTNGMFGKAGCVQISILSNIYRSFSQPGSCCLSKSAASTGYHQNMGSVHVNPNPENFNDHDRSLPLPLPLPLPLTITFQTL